MKSIINQETKGCSKCNKNKEVKGCKSCSETKKKLVPFFVIPTIVFIFTVVGIIETIKFVIGLFTQ
jgi:recombinational DNA repair protein RecR